MILSFNKSATLKLDTNNLQNTSLFITHTPMRIDTYTKFFLLIIIITVLTF